VNFLAHCLLADADGPSAAHARTGGCWRRGFLAGGVLGDFVKGPIPDAFPVELRAGLRLHRRIDSYSNRLSEMKTSVRRFPPALRRPAPILLDIVADHCLTLAWPRQTDEDITAFSGRVYAALGRFGPWVPEQSRGFLERMVEHDLMSRYADRDVVERAMAHVLERLGMTHLECDLPGILDEHLDAFAKDFEIYFPLLRIFAATERNEAAKWASAEATGERFWCLHAGCDKKATIS